MIDLTENTECESVCPEISVPTVVIISYYPPKQKDANKKHHTEYLETILLDWLSVLPSAFFIMKFGQIMT